MFSNFISEGNAAFVDENFEAALSCYSKAIDIDNGNSEAYALRSHAHIKLENYEEAIEDADKSIEVDPHGFKGYLRKGMACFFIDELETAKDALEQGLKNDPTNTQLTTWLRKCETRLAEEQAVAGRCPEQPQDTAVDRNQNGSAGRSNDIPDQASEDKSVPLAPCAAVEQIDKYRLEWFQTQSKVEVAVLAKRVTAERLSVTIGPEKLIVVIRDAEGNEEYRKEIDLFATVDVQKSKYELLSTKVEISLIKADSTSWLTLEKGATAKARVVIHNPEKLIQPHYPSSSRRKVDWDSIDSELKMEEKDEKLEGDAALQKLFQDIYANADEETRRAMNKSFLESNGTVLSTNWKEVGTKKVEVQAPSGTDPKKY